MAVRFLLSTEVAKSQIYLDTLFAS